MMLFFSSYAEAGIDEKDFITIPMSKKSYEVNVGRGTETTFFLPNNQRLLKIVGGDVNLDVDAVSTKNIETNDWSVSVIKKRRGYLKGKNRFHYEVHLTPKKNIQPTVFSFVTDYWEHKFTLVNSSAPVLLLIVDNVGTIGNSEFLNGLIDESCWLFVIFGVLSLFSAFLVYKNKA